MIFHIKEGILQKCTLETGDTEAVIPDGVKAIDEDAFITCDELVKIVIPPGVRDISGYPFQKLKNLVCIEVDKKNSVYSSENGLLLSKDERVLLCCPPSVKHITIPDSVKKIDSFSFFECDNLSEVTIPSKVEEIAINAFSLCDRLERITLGKGVRKICLPDAFELCPKFLHIDVSKDNVFFSSENGLLLNHEKSILLRCPEGLKTANIPLTVRKILPGAFTGCYNISAVKVNENHSFFVSVNGFLLNKTTHELIQCPPGLNCATLPLQVQKIGGNAFDVCASLSRIKVPKNHPLFSSAKGLLFNKEKTRLIRCPIAFEKDHLTLPCQLTKIEVGALKYCTSLKSIKLPKNTAYIGKEAFRGCDQLEHIHTSKRNRTFCSIDGVILSADRKKLILCPPGRWKVESGILTGVETIGNYTFSYCWRLLSVTLPEGVKSILDKAFYSCSDLKFVTIPKTTIEFGERIFSKCNNLTLRVSEASAAEKYAKKNACRYVETQD